MAIVGRRLSVVGWWCCWQLLLNCVLATLSLLLCTLHSPGHHNLAAIIIIMLSSSPRFLCKTPARSHFGIFFFRFYLVSVLLLLAEGNKLQLERNCSGNNCQAVSHSVIQSAFWAIEQQLGSTWYWPTIAIGLGYKMRGLRWFKSQFSDNSRSNKCLRRTVNFNFWINSN